MRTNKLHRVPQRRSVVHHLLWAKQRKLAPKKRNHPLHFTGHLYFVYSDDDGASWSPRRKIELPVHDLDEIPGRLRRWVNHSPVVIRSSFFEPSSVRSVALRINKQLP
jgi:hypothetical protein